VYLGYGFALLGGIPDRGPGGIDLGKVGLERGSGTWTWMKTCSRYDRRIPFGKSFVFFDELDLPTKIHI